MFASRPSRHPPKVLVCRASEVEPGDEVVIVDPSGTHQAVHAEYVHMDAQRSAVRVVPREGPEREVSYDAAVLVLRGGDLPELGQPPA